MFCRAWRVEDRKDWNRTNLDILTPEFFDTLVIANVIIGLAIAGRRFLRDIRGPLPDDAPEWAHARYEAASSIRSSNSISGQDS
ncbi:MAG: hypothetical protein OXE52_06720 [Chloroflexi bacterium]|nr:hypothetical protein [Chloroflexota bacterium]